MSPCLPVFEQEFKIGIVWQGSTSFRADYLRSCRLEHFAPLARIEGVRLFSLQKELGMEQLAEADFPVTDLGSRLENFMDTAAVLKNLDLVVAVDTAIVHCAGALGLPVWVALPFAADWRWLLERDGQPVVSNGAAVPAETLGRLEWGLCEHRGGSEAFTWENLPCRARLILTHSPSFRFATLSGKNES